MRANRARRGTSWWTSGSSGPTWRIKHISDGREPPEKGSDAPPAERGSLTFVLVKEQGSWRVALAQTTPIAV